MLTLHLQYRVSDSVRSTVHSTSRRTLRHFTFCKKSNIGSEGVFFDNNATAFDLYASSIELLFHFNSKRCFARGANCLQRATVA